MTSPLYNTKGVSVGTITVPDALFALPWNADLVHQVVTAMEANARVAIAHTKDRSEVAGGGKKPWRQKGTGRARHGSIRSPLWRGGGVTHGPRSERNFSQKINRVMARRALTSVLSKKYADGEILFVDTLSFAKPATKEAVLILRSLSGIDSFGKVATKKRNAALIVLPARDVAVELSMRNIGNVTVNEARNLNPRDMLAHTYLIIVNPEASFKVLAERVTKRVKTQKISKHKTLVTAA